ncbi:MAG: hypothetical protein ACLGI2_06530 [Acidimicrobiia bacterium]
MFSSIGALYRLIDLIPPPDSAVGAHGDWKRFVSANGFWPPEDYRMMIREYGAGTFAGWLTLIEPFNHTKTFVELVEVECRSLRGRAQGWPTWPAPGGFLPWARTSNGDHVGWLTEGRPEAWITVYAGAELVAELKVGAVGFLLGLAERNLGDPTFDGGNPLSAPGGLRFEPLR